MRYGSMFKTSLYDDRVKETESLKEHELKLYEWEKKEGQTFEQWKVEKAAREDELRLEKQKNAPSLLGRGGGAAAAPAASSKTSSTVELELDEEDQKILNETKNRGYCYFRRELTEDEKKMKDTVHLPQKLVSDNSAAAPAPLAEPSESPQRGVSSWNNGCTYEEKDTTNWVKTMLEKQLDDVCVDFQGDKEIQVTEVDNLTGDAQIMVVRGSLRHFFDMTADVKFEVQAKSGSRVLGRGVLKCDSISGAIDPAAGASSYLQGAKLQWKTPDSPLDVSEVEQCLKEALNKRISEFHILYKQKN